jgi:hypothetical protein
VGSTVGLDAVEKRKNSGNVYYLETGHGCFHIPLAVIFIG